ncbi:MAG: pyrroline-5-carboxylate reductase [Lagierella massiliensis]|nr:pyrroline-5-carboxylate reductase [Lagierella massiliensis]
MYELGFIGFGNMGRAMAMGAITNGYKREDIVFSKTVDVEKTEEEYKIKGFNSNLEVAKNSKVIILAIKPYQYEDVIREIKDEVLKDSIIVPITPSFTIDEIKKLFKREVKVARIMPNTPALVNCGITGVCFSENLTNEDKKIITNFLESFGEIVEIKEHLMGAVSSVSGSGPAYIYMLIEAMADMAVAAGIKRNEAYKLVAKTVEGSAKMVLETNKHPGELKDQVCSPLGSTIQGVMELEENGFRGSIIKGLKRTLDRFNEMNENK